MSSFRKLAITTLCLLAYSGSVNASLNWSWSFGSAPTNVNPTDTVYIPATVTNSSSSTTNFVYKGTETSATLGPLGYDQYKFDYGRDLTFPWSGTSQQWSGMQSLAPGESFAFTYATLTPYSAVLPGTYGIAATSPYLNSSNDPGATMCGNLNGCLFGDPSTGIRQAPTNQFLFTVQSPPPALTPPIVAPIVAPIVSPIITADIEPSKPIVVITHGWQPDGTPGIIPDWMLDMKHAIGTAANVVLKTWDNAITGYFDFQDALAEVALQGRALGRQLLALAEQQGSQVLDHLHFIGHSLGTYVNAYAADFLTRAGYTVEEFTILDRPFGNGLAAAGVDGVPLVNASGFDTPIFQQLLQRDKVIWVENYSGLNILSPPPAFGAPFSKSGDPTAYDYSIFAANHNEVHDWYACTMGVDLDNCLDLVNFNDGFLGRGYPWSLAGGRSEDRPDISWDPGTYSSVPFEVQLDPVTWLQINCQTELGVARCAEGSPAYLWNEKVSIPLDSEFLQFDFRWLNLGDGDYLSVHFDDTLLFNDLGSEFFGQDLISSGLIPIGAFSGMTGQLLFALNNVGESNASFEIANIEILTRSVPEPGTLLLAGIGLAAIVAMRRRREFGR